MNTVTVSFPATPLSFPGTASQSKAIRQPKATRASSLSSRKTENVVLIHLTVRCTLAFCRPNGLCTSATPAFNSHLHPERVLGEQEALHRHRCTKAKRFHPERPLARCTQTRVTSWLQAAGSCRCVHTEQLSVILSCPHQSWTLLRSTMGAVATSQEVQSDWREGLRDLAQSQVSNFNEAFDEVRNLLQ